MGSLPQHSAMELRRYLNRTLHMFPYISDMANIWRTPFDQYETFIVPLVAWLEGHGVNLRTGAFVQDIGFAPSHDRITVNRLDYERDGVTTSVTIAPDDLVLLTFGSQATDMSIDERGAASEACRTIMGAVEAPGTTTDESTANKDTICRLWPGFQRGRCIHHIPISHPRRCARAIGLASVTW